MKIYLHISFYLAKYLVFQKKDPILNTKVTAYPEVVAIKKKTNAKQNFMMSLGIDEQH